MRLTTLLIIISTLTISAKSFSQEVDLSLKSSPIEDVFNQIRQQTGYSFLWREHTLDGLPPVSVSVHKATLKETLEDCLKGMPLTYTMHGKVVYIQRKLIPDLHLIRDPKLLMPPLHVVKGIVTDSATGNPLVGVTVKVKGKSKGTVTDANGQFSLEVQDDAVLIISYLGYKAQEVPVDGKEELSIRLAATSTGLNQLVVVGYGTQENRDVTGSIGTVKMKNVQNQIVTGADELLTGQIAGVNVNQPAGIPGGGPTIHVRGVGAIGAGSQPLYVVDGFPLPRSSSVISNPLNNILPGDIASISVLKDASATAIYGSRGANGVVLIETKKGRAGKMHAQVSAYRGIQIIPKRGHPDLMNAREFAQWRKESLFSRIRYVQGREPTLADIPEAYRYPEKYGKGTDWYDEVTRVAPIQQLKFSISGGSDQIKSYISGGYFHQDGVVIGTDFSRVSFRANIDATIYDKIKVGFNLAPTFSKRNLAAVGGAGRYEPGLGFALTASPIPSVYNEDGSYVPMISSPGTFAFANPVMVLKEMKNESQTFHGLMTGFIQYKPLNILTLKSALNLAYSNTQSNEFHPSYIGGTNQSPPVIPSSNFGVPSFLNWDFENTLSYQDVFKGGHNIKAVVGYTYQKNISTGASFHGTDYPSDEVKTLNAAATITGSTTIGEWALMSYFARVNYSYKDKYLLTATFRRDGSSRFGENNRWGSFPSGSLGWRLSEEPFMNPIKWINNLKLRISYGITGNFNIGNYTYVSHVGTSDYVLGGSRASGQILTSLGNPDLKWERSREFDIGLNAGFWNDRVTLNFDVYKRNTVDMLLEDEIPESSGFSTVTVNRGNVVNRGLELGITSRNLSDKRKVQWTTNLTFALNRNKVLALGKSGAPIYAGFGGGGEKSNITMIGQPIGMFFGWKLIGLYQSEDDIRKSPSYPGAVPGDLKFKDVNGDGKLTQFDDFTIIGNPYPDFTWGLTNRLSYKNLSLRILITGSEGGEMYREDHHYYHNTDGVFNVSRDQQYAWKSLEDQGNGIVPNNAGSTSRRYYRMINSGAVENSSYAWVKNITLGYDFTNLPKYINRLHVYLSIQNAILFTSYGGSNPETSNYNRGSGAGVLAPGLDFVGYPVPRVITLGLNLNF